jgi:hypothetical protein
MTHAHTEKSTRQRQQAGKGHFEDCRVDGLPPNNNLRKRPDKAYGDTEMPRRGRTLESD